MKSRRGKLTWPVRSTSNLRSLRGMGSQEIAISAIMSATMAQGGHPPGTQSCAWTEA